MEFINLTYKQLLVIQLIIHEDSFSILLISIFLGVFALRDTSASLVTWENKQIIKTAKKKLIPLS
jgi:hypothetical protein